MPSITSANMGLTIPTVSQEPGPTYAIDINTSLSLIDAHNHTTGQGVQIPSSGLNINSDLTFAGYNATNLRSSRYSPQGAVLATASDVGCVYLVGVDLYCNDGNGNNIRITQSGGLAGTNGSISGLTAPASATYVPLNSTFVWQSGVTIAATMDMRSAILRNSSAGSKGLTLSPPAALAADATITFPNIPGAKSFMTIDAAGNIEAQAAYSAGLTTSNIASNTILASNVLAGQQLPLLTLSVTTNGSVTSDNAIVLCNTGGGSITRQLYSAAASSGYTIRIKKTSSDTNSVTVTTTGGQTIDGGSSVAIVTQNEVVTLSSDGTNWQLIDRQYPTTWISAGSISFSATTTPPTVGTGVNTDIMYYRRVGNTMICRIQYHHTGAGATGNGTYKVLIPGGWSIDTSLVDADTGTSTGNFPVNNGNGHVFIASGTDTLYAQAVVYDPTYVTFQGMAQSASQGFWGSGLLSFGSTALSANGTFEVPISGWG